MQRLRVASYRRSRWKNGKGETLEVAIAPPSATLDDFIWRISLAALDSDAEFSTFSGIDRTLAIIAGEGITIEVAGVGRTLRSGDEPFRFAGDVPARAKLIGGASTDLNVMTRRGVAGHSVAWALPGETANGSDAVTALFAVDEVTLRTGGDPHRLDRWDLLQLAADDTVEVIAGRALLVRIRVVG